MPKMAYVLSKLDAHIKDDGTGTIITLHRVGAEPVGVLLPSLEAVGMLAAQVNMISRKMIEMMAASGAAAKYKADAVEMPHPFRVSSARSGLSEDGTSFVMSLQTQEGPFLDFQMPADVARNLLASATEVKSTS